MTNYQTFSVRVPASTSNCGPGFDTLGIALTLYNRVVLTPARDGVIRYSGTNGRFQENEMKMVEAVANGFFTRTGHPSFGFCFDIIGEVPFARGLGSSVTLRAGILGGMNAAAGDILGKKEMVSLVTELEGHPDNAAAAILGGFCVSRTSPDGGAFIDAARFDVDEDLAFVVASPETEVMTSHSRKALPEKLRFSEVVQSLNSLAYIVSAFARHDYRSLQGAVVDFIHQPYREILIPGARDAIDGGVNAGAYAGWLSGSGSSVLCVCPAPIEHEVGEAMSASFSRGGVPARIYALRTDNEGLVVF